MEELELTPSSLFRLLRAPTDPPSDAQAYRKIDIAWHAWQSDRLVLPRKAVFLTKWLLEGLLKQRQSSKPEESLLSPRHWRLLVTLLPSVDADARQSLLLQIPFVPILDSLLASATCADAIATDALLVAQDLLPSATTKTTFEVPSTAYAAAIAYLARPTQGENMHALALMIVREWSAAIEAKAAHKKAFSLFIAKANLAAFIAAYGTSDTDTQVVLSESASAALFNTVQMQRAPANATTTSPANAHDIVTALAALELDGLRILPIMMRLYTESLKNNATALFGQQRATLLGPAQSQSALEVATLFKIRSHAFAFMELVTSALGQHRMDAVAESYLVCVGVLQQHALYIVAYGEEERSWFDCLQRIARKCLDCAESDHTVSIEAVQLFRQIMRLDFAITADMIGPFLTTLAGASDLSEIVWLTLKDAMNYYVKTKQLGDCLSLTEELLQTAYREDMANGIYASVEMDVFIRDAIAARGPNEGTVVVLQGLLAKHAAAATPARVSQPPRKKRRSDSAQSAISLVQHHALCRLTSVFIVHAKLQKSQEMPFVQLLASHAREILAPSLAQPNPSPNELARLESTARLGLAISRRLASGRAAGLHSIDVSTDLTIDETVQIAAVTELSASSPSVDHHLLSLALEIRTSIKQVAGILSAVLEKLARSPRASSLWQLARMNVDLIEPEAQLTGLYALALANALTQAADRRIELLDAELQERPRLRDALCKQLEQLALAAPEQQLFRLLQSLQALSIGYLTLAARRTLLQVTFRLTATYAGSDNEILYGFVRHAITLDGAVDNLLASQTFLTSLAKRPSRLHDQGRVIPNLASTVRAIATACIRHATDAENNDLVVAVGILASTCKSLSASQLSAAFLDYAGILLVTLHEQEPRKSQGQSDATRRGCLELASSIVSRAEIIPEDATEHMPTPMIDCYCSALQLLRREELSSSCAGTIATRLLTSLVRKGPGHHNELRLPAIFRLFVSMHLAATSGAKSAKANGGDGLCIMTAALIAVSAGHSNVAPALEAVLAAAIRAAQPISISRSLDLLAELIDNESRPVTPACLTAAQLYVAILKEVPEDASKVVYIHASRFLSQCRALLSDDCLKTTGDLSVITRCIEATLIVSIERLRATDISVVFSSLLRIFEYRIADDGLAHGRRILRDILESLLTMTRNRADVVKTHFPLVVLVLSHLFQIGRLSGVTPGSAMIGLDVPIWASGDAAIFSDGNARRLACFLTALTSRGTRARGDKLRKGEGRNDDLSAPMSKHSPFVLYHFLKASTASQAAISPSLRAELMPGFVEVLAVMGKHERDALMAGFLRTEDEAERTLLRQMLVDFERERYTG
ncbi:hypothetical protein E5Q_00329 [Mixia osmundae IAM 14324]|uniref:Nucleolar 27S pre-rRNA processing Urb2/Npa2 C-terminal domain-containing protein n=2 Tax=Mixia osmundae (strain CBS 9802 / IAM 14324 / JCM 22182 / KY 12970) TaxID=764103 RepID=G7DSX4_MIXOS|nr:hypothetical protein E5Q_00329 [Mixia osmundae IAM 14324]